MGLGGDGSYPHDEGDFMRCERLMDAVPEFRARIGEMSGLNRYWTAIAPHWEEIRASKDKTHLLKHITERLHKEDPGVIQLKGAIMRFGPIT